MCKIKLLKFKTYTILEPDVQRKKFSCQFFYFQMFHKFKTNKISNKHFFCFLASEATLLIISILFFSVKAYVKKENYRKLFLFVCLFKTLQCLFNIPNIFNETLENRPNQQNLKPFLTKRLTQNTFKIGEIFNFYKL